MSFSKEVKEELMPHIGSGRHCMIAELAAILSAHARLVLDPSGTILRVDAEHPEIIRKCVKLLDGLFSWGYTNLTVSDTELEIKALQDVEKVLSTAKLKPVGTTGKSSEGSAGSLSAGTLGSSSEEPPGSLIADNRVVQNTCCKRAFIRGAFLCSGSVSDPEKAYHFEIVSSDEGKAKQLQDLIRSFEVDAKVVQRKKYHVVYVKEGAQIVDVLNIMEAHRALMEFENVRIVKEVRNSVNRQVNCEAANINKTVTAASRQIEDIIYIRDHIGFDKLSEGLEEIARLRIEYPEATLAELGEMVSPPLGKSGVNHRLHKLGEIAEQYRN